MTEAEKLQVELFQIVEQQAALQAQHQQLEQAKAQRYEALKQLRAQEASQPEAAPVAEEPGSEPEKPARPRARRG